MKSRVPSIILVAASSVAALIILPVASTAGRSQENPTREVIQATAIGQQQSSGRNFHVTINIESFSTLEDQKTLTDAFASGGHDALVKVLSKMKSRGSVAITGTLGYQIAYLRSFTTENGRTIRLITDRPIWFGEASSSSRSKDYDLSGIELSLAPDPKQSTGSLVIAGKFKTDKTQQITFESYGSGPWRLVNILER